MNPSKPVKEGRAVHAFSICFVHELSTTADRGHCPRGSRIPRKTENLRYNATMVPSRQPIRPEDALQKSGSMCGTAQNGG